MNKGNYTVESEVWVTDRAAALMCLLGYEPKIYTVSLSSGRKFKAIRRRAGLPGGWVVRGDVDWAPDCGDENDEDVIRVCEATIIEDRLGHATFAPPPAESGPSIDVCGYETPVKDCERVQPSGSPPFDRTNGAWYRCTPGSLPDLLKSVGLGSNPVRPHHGAQTGRVTVKAEYAPERISDLVETILKLSASVPTHPYHIVDDFLLLLDDVQQARRIRPLLRAELRKMRSKTLFILPDEEGGE